MLHKFYPSVSPICDKCKSNDGTLLHLFWNCPLMYSFWSSIFSFFPGLSRDTPSWQRLGPFWMFRELWLFLLTSKLFCWWVQYQPKNSSLQTGRHQMHHALKTGCMNLFQLVTWRNYDLQLTAYREWNMKVKHLTGFPTVPLSPGRPSGPGAPFGFKYITI